VGGGLDAESIRAGEVTGTVRAANRRPGSHDGGEDNRRPFEEDPGDGPADETVRPGIGGTNHEIDLSERGRIPATIVQRYQAGRRGQ
jgi:hypothetical protein